MDSIRQVNPYDGKNAYTYYPVVIIGAGESGIAMGCRLKQELGFDQFRIFDRQAGLGGTWWISRYPGVACDVVAVVYSYTFVEHNDWTTLHPPGNEIVEYLGQVAREFEIIDKIQLDTNVSGVRWLDDEEQWEVTLTHLVHGVGDLSTADIKKKEERDGRASVVVRTEVVRAKVVVSCCGGLVQPKAQPDVPGFDTFKGDLMHTARWDNSVDLRDKDVIVLGTGCSAAQVVPQLVKPEIGAKSVTQLMRSPPWVSPNLMTPEELEQWEKWTPVLFKNIPGAAKFVRKFFFLSMEMDFLKIFKTGDWNKRNRRVAEARFLEYMRKNVPEQYHDILTPDYDLFCKRRVVEAEWFSSLHDPRIDLTTKPLTEIRPESIILGPGRHYPPESKTDSNAPTDQVELHADAIILANGYITEEFLHPLRVKGRRGKDLHEFWKERGGPGAYMGTALDDYPNFFMIYGPNMSTGHNSVIYASENQVNYALKFLKPILNGEVSTWEVKASAERNWTQMMQHELKNNTIFGSGGCSNWYTAADGWNANTYPFTQIDYTIRTWFPRWSHWQAKYTEKGILRRRMRRLRLVAVAASLVLLTVQMKRKGLSYTATAKGVVGAGLYYLAKGIESLRSRL